MSNVQTQLTMIASLLRRRKICRDVSPILNVIPTIGKNGGNSFIIEGLELVLPKPSNMRPNNIIKLVGIITVATDCKQMNEINIEHMFNDYFFNVVFKGYGAGKEECYYSSFHLDYEPSNSSNYIHPWFHLTYGGINVKNLDHGELMILPAPRIPFWPMDFMLGLDFILSNFLDQERYNTEFIADSNYRSALKKSQDSIWRPYILSISHHWCKFSDCKYNMVNKDLSHNYVPTLIKDAEN